MVFHPYRQITVDEVKNDLIDYSYRYFDRSIYIKEKDYVGIKVKLDGGYLEFPFRFDWFARMVEFYGLESATWYSQMLLQKWLD